MAKKTTKAAEERKDNGSARSKALKAVPQDCHALADYCASSGVPWDKIPAIIMLLAQILPEIIRLLTGAQADAKFGAEDCPDHVKAQSTELRKAACELLAQAVCMEHCCGGHDH